MKILNITSTDLVGGRFNGMYLNKYTDKFDSNLLVWKKTSVSKHVFATPPENKIFHHITNIFLRLSNRFSLDGLLGFGGFLIKNKSYFIEADVIHIHMIHGESNFSILSLPEICKLKPVVWTFHDPWATTGGCVHSFDCNKWMYSCSGICPYPRSKSFFQSFSQNLHFKIKKKIYDISNFEIIVASHWMQDRVLKSRLVNQKVSNVVPFGVDLSIFKPSLNKNKVKMFLNIPPENIVISFRAELLSNDKFKGMLYLYRALEILDVDIPITLLIVGNGNDFYNFNDKFQVINLGWIDGEDLANFYSVSDIFLMPSVQETFGMMAIESMASGTPVISFENTSLSEIVSEGGLLAKYKCSVSLKNCIEKMVKDDHLRKTLSINARFICENNFDINIYIENLYSIYTRVQDSFRTKNV